MKNRSELVVGDRLRDAYRDNDPRGIAKTITYIDREFGVVEMGGDFYSYNMIHVGRTFVNKRGFNEGITKDDEDVIYDPSILVNANFVMAKRDVMTQGDGYKFEGFTCGHIYPVEDRGDGNRRVVSERSYYYLPHKRFKQESNGFFRNFVIVESEDAVVEPYSTIRKLNKTICDVKTKYAEEMEPIIKRRNDELDPYEKQLKDLMNKIK